MFKMFRDMFTLHSGIGRGSHQQNDSKTVSCGGGGLLYLQIKLLSRTMMFIFLSGGSSEDILVL